MQKPSYPKIVPDTGRVVAKAKQAGLKGLRKGDELHIKHQRCVGRNDLQRAHNALAGVQQVCQTQAPNLAQASALMEHLRMYLVVHTRLTSSTVHACGITRKAAGSLGPRCAYPRRATSSIAIVWGYGQLGLLALGLHKTEGTSDTQQRAKEATFLLSPERYRSVTC